MPLKEESNAKMVGHVLIRDADTHEVLVDKNNSINFENMSNCLALALSNNPTGPIYQMVFGSGASTISGIGQVTYFPPNVVGQDAQLYNETYQKIVDATSPLMPTGQQSTNFMTVQHSAGNTYTDIIVTCTLGYGEPSGQDAFDTTTATSGSYIFDELGLKAYNEISDTGFLLTHCIFNSVDKSLNRVIEIIYTLRIYMN